MALIDTHAHLDQEEFDQDRADAIARAADAGVLAVVAVGTTAQSSEATVRIAERFDGVWAAVGIQPNYAGQAERGDWDRIVELAAHPRVVALGETGLDRYWDHTPLDVQQDYFDRHLRLAATRALPVVIHMRDCGADILAMLRDAHRRDGSLRGVMHSFTVDSQWTTHGDAGQPRDAAELAAECVALGLYISFAGMVTYKKSDDLRRVATTVPAERILVETDSPYLSPHPLRGRRNEPAHVMHTARLLAEVRGTSADEFAAQTTANARRVFRLPT
jgi:TatD DNase family protein